jgi:lincosamide nucleotidyltransferase A/C/D/E
MKQEDVIELYTTLDKLGIQIWIGGGWGVDALLGEQTRPHGDLDIQVQEKDLEKMCALLKARGYKDVPRGDTCPWNFVWGDEQGRQIDFHVIVFNEAGDGVYGPVERGVVFAAASLSGKGKIGALPVKCISPEYQVKFHTGYKLRENDFKDVDALCKKFNIEYPEEYRRLKQSRQMAPKHPS